MHVIVWGVFLGFLVACNEGGDFQGAASQAETPDSSSFLPESEDAKADPVGPSTEPDESPMETALEPAEEVIDIPQTAVSEEDLGALAQCLQRWPDHPFSPEEIAKPKTYLIAEGTDNNALIFSDSEQSPAPSLKLVVFDIRNGNQSELLLGDENGWYCLYFKAKIVNNFTISQQCGSRLAVESREAQNMNNFLIHEICE